MTVVNKVIHRFIRERSEYEEGGALYNQIIPYNVQAYSYKLRDNGNPNDPNDYTVAYVLGTGSSTYMEIANGEGKDSEGNPCPALSKEIVITSVSELNSLLDEKVTHLEELNETTARLHKDETVQYIGETTEDYITNYFYKSYMEPAGYVINQEGSRLTGISNIIIDQEKLNEALESYGLNLPLDFQADHRHYWTCVSPMGGHSLGISEEALNNIWGITWDGTPEYVTSDLFTIIDIEEQDTHYYWERVDVQPSVAVTSEPNRIYGTNEEGNQTTYDVDSLSLVDDVRVDGESVVVDQIANITLSDRIRKLEELPTIPESTSDGEIVQYVGETDENHVNGYFYKATEVSIESTLEHHVISAILNDEDIIVNKTTFEEYVQPTENTIINFIYNAENSVWMLEGEAIDLSNYGVEITSLSSPEDGDSLYLDYRVATYTYSWEQINVQPETDISNKVDKVETPNQVYGTDDQGEQTTYDLDSFGLVDDVLVDGNSVVDNDKIAHIDLTGKVDKTDTASQIYGTDDQGEQITYNVSDFQETLVNQVNIKSVNGESLLGSGNLELGQYLVFPNSWPTSSSVTTKQFCDVVAEDSTAVEGKMYLGEVRFSDLSTVGLVNAEIVVKIMKGTTTASKVIVLDMTSGNHAPYRWQYTYWNHGSDVSGWIGFVPTTDIASKVYGTDAQGNQTTYNLDDFGAIDDVRVDGQSVVTDSIANITLSDRIRKLEILPVVAGSTTNGEIVQYVGVNTTDYINGYFYKASSEPVGSTVTPHMISSTVHDEDITINKTTFEEYVQPTTDLTLHFDYNSGNWFSNGAQVTLSDYGITINSLVIPNDGDELVVDYRVPTVQYNWIRVNVQPVTNVIDSLQSTSTVDALSANMGYELNERINNVEGRGRYLSVWNCLTGLPETNPQTSPYEYHSGDYFIVGTTGHAHAAEITSITQTVGTTLSDLAVQDIEDFESQLSELVDTTLIFVFDNNNNWTLEGNVVDITNYSITYTGTPVEGDRIRVVYSAEVINYRPSGTEYVIDVASTTIETGDVVINDTYIYDGTTWVLQASGQREITFSAIAGSPYDNNNLGAALNEKVDDVQVNGVSVVVNNVANVELDPSNMPYLHPDHVGITSVEDALNELLYIEPQVVSFTLSGQPRYEIGTTISSVTLSWVWNKTMTNQSLNQGIGSVPLTDTSYVYTPVSPINSDTTFTLTGGDGINTASASASIHFLPSKYYGVSTLTSLTDADILGLTSELSNTRQLTTNFNCSGGKYFYIIIRSDQCSGISFKVNGMTFSDMDVETRNVVNASGYTAEYNIYRVHNIQTGSSIPVQVL